MPSQWITLPHSWTLQDTQAGLNVIIAFLSAGGIFVLVRYFWVSAARKVASDKEVPSYSLMSLNTIGETIDIIWLLRKDLLTGRYFGLLVQCVCVLLLTACALLSGFIARFSARYTTIWVPRHISGTLAQRSPDTTYFSGMETNIALSALRTAGIPQDRLLDFWPDPSSVWRYTPDQWADSTWSLSCRYTPLSELTEDVRAINSTCEDGFSSQLPFLDDLWDDKARNYSIRYGVNTWRDKSTMTRPGIVFAYGDELPESGWDSSLRMYTNMNLRMAMLFLDGPVYDWNYTFPGHCVYEVGPLTRAVYTKAECELNRNTRIDANRTLEEIKNWGAYPEADHSRVLDVLLEYYGNKWYREVWSRKPVTTIDGPELALFYQAYCITRDTKGFLFDNTTTDNTTSSRLLSMPIHAPQVSLTCVIVCSVAACLVSAGLLNYVSFLFLNRKYLDRTPQSKLDWMLRTLRQDNERHSISMMHSTPDAVGLGIHHHESELTVLNKGDGFDMVGLGARSYSQSRSQSHQSNLSMYSMESEVSVPTPLSVVSRFGSMHQYQQVGGNKHRYQEIA